MDLLRILIAILLPPLGVFLQVGIGDLEDGLLGAIEKLKNIRGILIGVVLYL